MTDQSPKTPAGPPLSAAPGSARPSHQTVRFVERWLWNGQDRQTSGCHWDWTYIHDAACMIEDALAQNAKVSGGE